MCLVVISWKNHTDHPLLISANRDEFFERPTAALHLWESGFYAGKDLRGGGTWLGVHPNGRWALLTNFRDFHTVPSSPLISRGSLVKDFLESGITPENYLQVINSSKEKYDGFNLLVSDGKALFYLSSHTGKPEELTPGIYGLSNGLINSPWPKVDLAKKQLKELPSSQISEDRLLSLLKSTATYPLDLLPRTGVPELLEIKLSAQLIRLNDDYGTVSSTAVILDKDHNLSIKERRFQWDYAMYTDVGYQFPITQTF